MRTIVDANPGNSFQYGFYADVSPDGTRVVYSSCEYPRCPKGTDCEEVEVDPDDRRAFDYEIATIGIDGTSPERLTRNGHSDHYPVWSPDGKRIAFLVSRNLARSDVDVSLFTMSADGSDVKVLTPPTVRVGLYPPVWSPDGRWLAFVAEGGVLWTVRADGGYHPNRIGRTSAVPSWSPDSEWLAYADGAGIHRARPNGQWFAQVWEKSKEYRPITMVSWSPDGSELLFVTDDRGGDRDKQGQFVVGADGRDLRHFPISWLNGWTGTVVWTVWSPDGLRIAVYGRGDIATLITMARDGADMRFLAGVDSRELGGDGGFHPWSPPRLKEPVDLAVCSRGFVVAAPESNPGLVQDCETLLRVRDTLAGSGELKWSEDLTIGKWEGVKVGGWPPRVHELVLEAHGLAGRLPPGLVGLSELRYLVIRDAPSHKKRGVLTGGIPPEYGSFTKLLGLDLSGNFLSGRIPPELSALTTLASLDLAFNFLSGSIPLELGENPYLSVNLEYNNPSLCVPAELPERWRRPGEVSKKSVRVCSPDEVGSR